MSHAFHKDNSGHPCCSGLFLFTEEEPGALSHTLLPEVIHSGIGLESRIKLGHVRARLWVTQRSPLCS